MKYFICVGHANYGGGEMCIRDSSYTGRYKVEESTDGINYTVKYQPTADELQKVYTCLLYTSRCV